VTIAEHEMAAANFKRYFKEQQDRVAQLGALTICTQTFCGVGCLPKLGAGT